MPSITDPSLTSLCLEVFRSCEASRVSLVAVPGGLVRPGLGVPVALPGKRESQVAKQPELRSAAAVGIEWASRVTTVAMGFSVPPLVGFGIDRWLGWTPVATLIGIVLGFVSGLLQTLRLSNDLPGDKPPAPLPRSRDPKPSDSAGGEVQEGGPGSDSR